VGVLTDYFVARDDQDAARAHNTVGGPRQAGFKTAAWKSIDPVVTLAVLNEIVTGTNALEWIKTHGGDVEMVAGGNDDERWVFRIAPLHVDALMQLPEDVRPIAERWAKSEELDGADPKDLAEVLRDLRALAREARASSQQLYCWVSL